MAMGTIRKRIALFRCFPREGLEVVDLEREMGQVRSNDDRAALVELADLDFFLASWRLEENELRTAPGSVPAGFLQPEDVSIKRDGFFQIGYAVPRVEKLFK